MLNSTGKVRSGGIAIDHIFTRGLVEMSYTVTAWKFGAPRCSSRSVMVKHGSPLRVSRTSASPVRAAGAARATLHASSRIRGKTTCGDMGPRQKKIACSKLLAYVLQPSRV